jgi:signal transduction histidine kinase
LNLINDILDLAKIEAGKVYVYPEKISLSELKEELERQFYPIAREKELDFLIQVDSEQTFFIASSGVVIKITSTPKAASRLRLYGVPPPMNFALPLADLIL